MANPKSMQRQKRSIISGSIFLKYTPISVPINKDGINNTTIL
jgi:hypothetical protein